MGEVEIMPGRERRRRWSLSEKLRIVAEAQEPGARVCDVAARHDVCDSLIFTWRRQVREGVLGASSVPSLVPVQVAEPARAPVLASTVPAVASSEAAAPSMIEIALPDGSRVRIGQDVELPVLRRVLAALRA